MISKPNRLSAEVRNRMQVLFQPEQVDAWLDGSAGKEVLVPAPENMLHKRPVSKRVNSSKAAAEGRSDAEPIRVALVGIDLGQRCEHAFACHRVRRRHAQLLVGSYRGPGNAGQVPAVCTCGQRSPPPS